MKEYEQKICNIIENMKTEIRHQCDNMNEQAYKQGYKQGYVYGKQDGYEDGKADTPFTDTEEAEKKAYDRGLNDAWELVKRIESTPEDGGLTNKQILEVFGQYWSSFELYGAFSVEEAMNLMKAYEDKQKQDDWRDIPSDEMTLEQARRAVKELRAEVMKRIGRC